MYVFCPGYPYGPEYNDGNEVMFSVLGFDGFKALSCMPRAGDSPEGLFKMHMYLMVNYESSNIYDDTKYNFTSIF